VNPGGGGGLRIGGGDGDGDGDGDAVVDPPPPPVRTIAVTVPAIAATAKITDPITTVLGLIVAPTVNPLEVDLGWCKRTGLTLAKVMSLALS
jgi:hypothetical protein